MPVAPERLSTITGWPRASVSRCANTTDANSAAAANSATIDPPIDATIDALIDATRDPACRGASKLPYSGNEMRSSCTTVRQRATSAARNFWVSAGWVGAVPLPI